jgi:anti-sigma regulatory factor (Ser/Thr protein kinase)
VGAGRAAAKPVSVVAEALASNAHQHTLSGDPGGTVRVVIDIDPFLITIAVTDNGPRPDTVIPYPRLGDPRLAPLSGLHLVDQLAVYWEWDWCDTKSRITSEFTDWGPVIPDV